MGCVESVFLAARSAAGGPAGFTGTGSFASTDSFARLAGRGGGGDQRPADADDVPALPVRPTPARPAPTGPISTGGRTPTGPNEAATPSPAVQVPASAPAGLPRREPIMAPQLRENRPGTPKGPLAGRSPEQGPGAAVRHPAGLAERP